jgi:shikimate dehydrogenase
VRAAVLGQPVAHSLSPVLHLAAYRALGLTDRTFERIECDGAGLPGLVAGLDDSWAGLAVTMPGKRAAYETADEHTPRAAAVGVANTLLRLPSGRWRADCTDVAGVTGALTAAGFTAGSGGASHAVILGAGGTATAALAALAELNIPKITLIARTPTKAHLPPATAPVAAPPAAGSSGAEPPGAGSQGAGSPGAGSPGAVSPGAVPSGAESSGAVSSSSGSLAAGSPQVVVSRWADTDFAALRADVLISTVPTTATAPIAADLATVPCVLDVIYHPWPTPLAEAVQARGGLLATGLDMLLHQAFGQVEQFTGHPAPRPAMRTALITATNTTLPLPC